MADAPLALFVPTFHGGGAERVMVQLARALRAAGEDVVLVAARAEGAYAAEAATAAPVVDLAAPRVWRAVSPLAAWLRRVRPRVLLATLEHGSIVAAAAVRLARTGTPLVVREANATRAILAGIPRARRLVEGPLLRWSYRTADHMVTQSQGAAEELVAHFGIARDGVTVIHNPIVGPAMRERATAAPAHPWFADDGPPVVLALGRLVPQKDFGTLLAAIARVRAARPVRCVIAGEGPLRDELVATAARLGIADDLALPGFVDNPFALMARAAVVALSSRHEGMPGVLVQAMALGARIVATDCPYGPHELLEGGKWGTLVPVGDAAALGDGIAAALDAPPPAVPEAVIDRFSIDGAAARYRALLHAVAERAA